MTKERRLVKAAIDFLLSENCLPKAVKGKKVDYSITFYKGIVSVEIKTVRRPSRTAR